MKARSLPLPRRTLDYLANGAQPGQRNEELLQAAIQFRDAGFAHANAERDLMPRAEADGLSTAEARATIASAYRRPARNALASRTRYTPRPYFNSPNKTIEPVKAVNNFLKGFTCGEADLGEASPIRPPDNFRLDGALLVSQLFDDGELVNIVTNYKADADGKARPGDAGLTLPRNEMIRHLQNGNLKSDAGGWIRMNPLDGKGVADANVTGHRFALIEGDTLPLELQLHLLCRLPLPIAVILTSGARSLHAWVKVDAKDAKEYQATVGKMLNLLARLGMDAKNKNASRLSRLPGVVRRIKAEGDGRQRLLYLNPDPQQKAIL